VIAVYKLPILTAQGRGTLHKSHGQAEVIIQNRMPRLGDSESQEDRVFPYLADRMCRTYLNHSEDWTIQVYIRTSPVVF
jgi:hypothetical protein